MSSYSDYYQCMETHIIVLILLNHVGVFEENYPEILKLLF